MAKKTRASEDVEPSMRRGGRPKEEWKLLTPEQLMQYRKDNGISRARLAEMLGVSSTSVQNWETGKVPAMKSQRRLVELMAAGPGLLTQPMARPGAPLLARGDVESDAAVTSTGTIVAAYARATKKLSPDELLALIRSVRQALS